MIRYTPRKFLDTMELNDVTITNLVNIGLYRSYFVPRYKKGSRKAKDLGDYRKGLQMKTIEKIADVLVDLGYFEDRELIIDCFRQDNFERLLPQDLL